MAAAVCNVFRQSLPEVSARELHVLAVDDSHVDRKVIERLLKISSCKVTVVESGTRALQYLGLDGDNTTDSSIGFEDSMKVNLIMTDYSMPGMTGFELLKKIKESSVLREIPVVVMSSENILTRIDSCLEEGAEEFLLKPVKLADVRRVTDFVMRGEEKKGGKSVTDFVMRGKGKKGGKSHQKRSRSGDSSPLSTELSPLSPSTSPSKKSRL